MEGGKPNSETVGPGSGLARVTSNPVSLQRETVGQALEPDFARDPATFPGNRGQIADPETSQWRTVDNLLAWHHMRTISLGAGASVRRVIIAACGLLAVVLWTRQVSATPESGIEDCTLCHNIPLTGMSLTNFQTQTNLGAGLLKVFQAPAGAAAIQYSVDYSRGGYYALNFNSPTNGGFDLSADRLSYTPGATWDRWAGGTYFTVGPTTNDPAVWTFNLGIGSNTPPDIYLMKTIMAGVDDSYVPWSQVEFYYVQVLPRRGPAPALFQARRIGSAFSVDVATSSGSTYYLEYKAALDDASWTPAAQVSGDGAVQTLTAPGATAPQRFYRLRVN